MNRLPMRALPLVVLAALAAGATGCSDSGTTPSDVASKAASAVQSVGADLDSAAAEAKKKLDGVKDGVNAKDQVTLGAVAQADGRSTVPVTVSNTATDKKSFAVQVNFRDGGGNLLDTVVVTVSDVAAGASGQGTARSTRSLSGEVKAETGTALRY
ncbi:hypothetical protein ACGFXC_29815 [Streptomyces sp. NPDC048507]|uniref:hypothetical protein n=1 Tax=Streptomyces sp. NPDC048507 TaxID=3365560 RepID=UPI00371D0FD9